MRYSLPQGVAAIVLTALLSACAADAAGPDSGWTAVREAEPYQDTPEEPAEAARTQSLGAPFRIVAASEFRDDDQAVLIRSGSALLSSWMMMSSDACDVTLEALALELRPSAGDSAGAWIASVGPVTGFVTSSSSESFRATFPLVVAAGPLGQAEAQPQDWGGHEAATAWLEATEENGAVVLRVRVRADDEAGTLARVVGTAELEVLVRGDFARDPSTVPTRRRECPR